MAGQLTEDIKAALARFDWLRVVPASNSSFAESKLPNARTVALARGVHDLVTGCLWQADDRVRWTVRLLVPNTGKFIWAEQYDNDLSKALAARDEIAQKTASIFAYRLKTERAARLIPALVEDMNVNDWVLLGETIAGVTIDGNHLARQAYRTALDLDPNCAMAHAGLAHSHVIDSIFWHSDDVEFSLELARYYAEKGANLNHTNSKPEWVLGHVFAEMKDPRRAEKHFEGAIKLNPLDADAYVMNAVYLTQAGRYLEGMSLCEHALKLNPTQPGWYLSVLGNCLFHLGRYHEAVRYMRCFYDKWPAFRPAQLGLAACYAELGEYGEARNLVDKVLALAPDTSLGQELKVLSRRYGNAHMERRLKALRKAGVPE